MNKEEVVLSPECTDAIVTILNDPNADEVIRTLIVNYASMQNVYNSLSFLMLLCDRIHRNIQEMETKAMDNITASRFMMEQLHLADESVSIPKQTEFSYMCSVCKVMFPEGEAVDASESQQSYFDKFLELFQDKKVFSWKRDNPWACQFGFADYLHLVEQKLASRNAESENPKEDEAHE